MQQRDVDQVGEHPDAVQENHHDQQAAPLPRRPPDQQRRQHQGEVRAALHGDLLDVRPGRVAQHDAGREDEHRDAPEQAQDDLQGQHDAQETQPGPRRCLRPLRSVVDGSAQRCPPSR